MKKINECLFLFLFLLFGFFGQWLLVSKISFLKSDFTSQLNSYLRLGIPTIENVLATFVLWVILACLFYFTHRTRFFYRAGSIGEFQERGESRSLTRRRPFRYISYAIIFLAVAICLDSIIFFLKRSNEVIPYSILIFITIILLTAVSFWLFEKREKKVLQLPWKDIGIVAVIIFSSLLILGYNLRYPQEMVADEAASWSNVRSILRGEYKGDIFVNGYYTYPVFNAFVQAGIIRIFHVENLGIAGWRFASIPVAIVAIIGVYFLCLEIFSRRVGILAALILSVNPYFMIFSRISLPTIQSLVPPLFTVLFLIKAIRINSIFFSSLAGIISGLGFYVYPPGRIAVLIGGIYFLYLFLSEKKWRKLTIFFATYFMSFVLIVLPIVSNGLFVDREGSMDKFYESAMVNVDQVHYVYPEVSLGELATYLPLLHVHPKHTIYFHPIIYTLLLRNTLVTFISFFHPDVIYNLNFYSSLGGFEWGFFIFIGMFFFIFFIKKGKERVLLLFWFLITFLVLGVYFGAAQVWHIEPILPILAIFAALAIDVIISVGEMVVGKNKAIILASISLLVLFFISAYKYFYVIHKEFNDDRRFDWDLASWVNDAKKGQMVVYIYDPKEGIRYGAGKLYDYMHLHDVRYQAISSKELENAIVNLDKNGKYIFFFEDKADIAKRLDLKFEKGTLRTVFAKDKEKILFYRYSTIL